LLFKASARYLCPSPSLPVSQTLSVVRLCEWKEGSHFDEVSSQKRDSLTRLIFKASARYWTPLFSIELFSTSSSVRVFKENERVLVLAARYVDDSSYLIDLQGISKVTSTFTTNPVVRHHQSGQCLWIVLRWMEKKKKRSCFTLLIFSASLICWIPSSPKRFRERLINTSVYEQSDY
jgi:hypothetical protein